MKFTRPWLPFAAPDGTEHFRPVLEVYLRRADSRLLRETFLVDSGADISMAPRRLCELLGISWETGGPLSLQGISPREECTVQGMVHSVELFIRDAACRINVPICFAEGDAPLLLGQEGFFDAFRVLFDKPQRITIFEQV